MGNVTFLGSPLFIASVLIQSACESLIERSASPLMRAISAIAWSANRRSVVGAATGEMRSALALGTSGTAMACDT